MSPCFFLHLAEQMLKCHHVPAQIKKNTYIRGRIFWPWVTEQMVWIWFSDVWTFQFYQAFIKISFTTENFQSCMAFRNKIKVKNIKKIQFYIRGSSVFQTDLDLTNWELYKNNPFRHFGPLPALSWCCSKDLRAIGQFTTQEVILSCSALRASLEAVQVWMLRAREKNTDCMFL